MLLGQLHHLGGRISHCMLAGAENVHENVAGRSMRGSMRVMGGDCWQHSQSPRTVVLRVGCNFPECSGKI